MTWWLAGAGAVLGIFGLAVWGLLGDILGPRRR
jgi:hypothetical protein